MLHAARSEFSPSQRLCIPVRLIRAFAKLHFLNPSKLNSASELKLGSAVALRVAPSSGNFGPVDGAALTCNVRFPCGSEKLEERKGGKEERRKSYVFDR